MSCNAQFLEEVKFNWEVERKIDAYTFPRLLEMAERVLELERKDRLMYICKVEEKNLRLKDALEKVYGQLRYKMVASAKTFMPREVAMDTITKALKESDHDTHTR